jgi:hypothetical protein
VIAQFAHYPGLFFVIVFITHTAEILLRHQK